MSASYRSPIDGTGHLTAQDLLVVLAALADGVRWQEYRQSRCQRCLSGLPCPQHEECDALIVRYRAVSRGLGDDR